MPMHIGFSGSCRGTNGHAKTDWTAATLGLWASAAGVRAIALAAATTTIATHVPRRDRHVLNVFTASCRARMLTRGVQARLRASRSDDEYGVVRGSAWGGPLWAWWVFMPSLGGAARDSPP